MPGISGVVYRCGEVKLWTENGAQWWELAGVCGIHSARCARRPWYRRDRMHDDGTADCRDAEAEAYCEHGRGCERGDSYKGWAVIVSCRRRVGRRGTASTSGTGSSCGLSNTSATGTEVRAPGSFMRHHVITATIRRHVQCPLFSYASRFEDADPFPFLASLPSYNAFACSSFFASAFLFFHVSGRSSLLYI